MELVIFAKVMTSKDARKYNRYLTKLTKTDGTELTVNVKFREECGEPKNCPANIIVDKSNCNYVEKLERYEDKETGEVKEACRRTLWVTAWEMGAPYVDHSMDDFI